MKYNVYIPNGNQSGYVSVGELAHKDDAELVMNSYSVAYIAYMGEIIAHVGHIPELA